MAQIVTEHLVDCLAKNGFGVMKKPAARVHSISDVGPR